MLMISKYDTTGIEQKITEFEAKHKFRFPEQYRRFLLKYNGGYTPETEFKVKPRRKEIVLAFYGYGIENSPYDITRYTYMLEEWIETGYIAIATDGLGGDYLIGINPKNYGKIYLCDYHEETIELVRDNFYDFISSCKSGKIDPDVYMSIEEREADLIARGFGHNITDGLKKMWQEEIDFYGNMVQEKVILD